MKLFILTTPSTNVFHKEHINKFKNLCDVILIDTPQPFENIKELFQGNESRILALDPDFCGWKLPDNVLTTIPNLKAVCVKTTSFNWVNSALAKANGIPVTNNRGWTTQAVTEWIIMTALFLARKIPLMIHEGWHKDFFRYRGTELHGKTAGILGLGRIGTRLSETCKALGMNVKYWSKHSRDKRFTYTPIEKIIMKADFIFPVWANNEETKTLLSKALLKKINPNAIFVDIYIAQDTHERNTLIDLAESGNIQGYGFEAEDNQFMSYKGNVAAIPENAWPTKEAIERNARQWSDAIILATQGKFPTRVN